MKIHEKTGNLRKTWLLLQPGMIAVVAAVGFILFTCCGIRLTP